MRWGFLRSCFRLGLNEEGILRISGSVAEINKMRDALTHGEEVDFNEHDVNAIAGLLKV